MKNLKDEQYIFELNKLPESIALKKKNSAIMQNGTIVIKLQKNKKAIWKNFIDPSLLEINNKSFDVKSTYSDISEGFFDDVDDEELRSEMDKLIFQALQS